MDIESAPLLGNKPNSSNKKKYGYYLGAVALVALTTIGISSALINNQRNSNIRRNIAPIAKYTYYR